MTQNTLPFSPSDTPDVVEKRQLPEDVESTTPSATSSPNKRVKLDTPEASEGGSDKENTSASTLEKAGTEKPSITKKQLEKLERQKQRELEKIERDRKKEEERVKKEEERIKREDERKKKLQEKELEKEARRKKLEDEKIERDRKKEEERLKKLAKREELERIRLDKKNKLEEEKKKAEEEKKKAEEAKRLAEEAKERSQMKISSFFTRQPQASPSREQAPKAESSTVSVEDSKQSNTNSSQQEKSNSPSTVISSSAQNSPSKLDSRSPYDRVFLPFFQKRNVIMAKSIHTLSADELKTHKESFDSMLQEASSQAQARSPSSTVDVTYKEFITSCKPPTRGSQVVDCPTPAKILSALNSSESTESQIYSMIEKLPPIKYIQFYENSKPPYIGTWCSDENTKIDFPAHQPFFKIPSGIDYDYDSDFDWNEEEDGEEGEGEDIDNDEEEEEDEEDDPEEGGEFEDFVDTNGEGTKKRKKFVGPLISLSIWNDGGDDEFFNLMKYEPINEKIQFPIDPNYPYWSRKKQPQPETEKSDQVKKAAASDTKDKATLKGDSSKGTSSPAQSTVTSVIGSKASPNVLVAQKPKIQDKKALLELVQFVEENNDFTIGTLVELSQKKLKVFTKALIKHTIQDLASYNKKTGKWEINTEFKEKLAATES